MKTTLYLFRNNDGFTEIRNCINHHTPAVDEPYILLLKTIA